MIVHTGCVGHALQHGIQGARDFRRGHAGAEFLTFRRFIGDGLHGQVEHNLITASMSFLRNLRRMWMIRKNRQGQGVVQSKDGIEGAGITANIIQNDGEASARYGGVRRMGCRMQLRGAVRRKERLKGGFDFAAAGKRHAEACQNHAQSKQGFASATGKPEIHRLN